MLEVRLLGQFDVRRDGRAAEIPSRPAQSLFAYLILNPGIAHRREMLAGLLWPDSPESNARSYLRHALWRIRQALGDSYLHSSNITIAYNPSLEYWLDVSLLEKPFIEGTSMDQLLGEVSVYKGDLLPGFYDEWIVPERERLHSMFDHKMGMILNSLVEARRWREILKWGEHWIALSNAAEPAYRALMEAHSGLGNRAGVVSVYERCVETLRDELGVNPSELTQNSYQLHLRDKSLSSEPSEVTEPAVRLDFTTSHTRPFVGRQRELAEIVSQLEDPSCRLLTLVGPGGIGKTRIALELAGHYKNGGCFVPLSAIELPILVVPTIAEALGLSFYGGQDPKTRLLNYLRDKEALLILDSYEHLLEGAELVAEMLRSAPGVKILATSRERLNLQVECLYEVMGMDFPDNLKVEDIEAFSAVELFSQNARRLHSAYSLSDEDMPHVVRICRLVEGMPLAIELAASWVRLLSCREIADELENSLDLLSAPLRDVPARHQSLRAVFEHSWNLLSETDRGIFTRLSIFRGGFTKDAASQVAQASLFSLSSLADKSLLRWTPSGRYQVHQVLAQYGNEVLTEHPDEKKQVGDAHCAYYADFARQQHANLKGRRQKEALHAIESEIDNLRAAWNWAVEHSRIEQIAWAIEGLYSFYLSRGWFEEGAERMRGAVELLRKVDRKDPDRDITLTLGKALIRRGSLCADLGRSEEAKAQLNEGLSLMRDLGVTEEVVFALNALGGLAWDLGEHEEATQCHQESVVISRETTYQRGLSVSLDNLGFVTLSLGRLEEAKNLILESVEIAREIDDQMGVASPLGKLGWVAYVEGELETAQVHFEEAISIADDFDNRMVKVLNQAGLSLTMNALHQYDRAKQVADASLTAARDIGYQLAIVLALGSLGEVLRVEGDYQQARVYLLEGFTIAIELGLLPMYLLLLIVWGSLLADEGDGEPATEVLSLVRHSGGELAVFGRIAQSRLDDLQARLLPEVFAAASQKGQEANLETLVHRIIE